MGSQVQLLGLGYLVFFNVLHERVLSFVLMLCSYFTLCGVTILVAPQTADIISMLTYVYDSCSVGGGSSMAKWDKPSNCWFNQQ